MYQTFIKDEKFQTYQKLWNKLIANTCAMKKAPKIWTWLDVIFIFFGQII